MKTKLLTIAILSMLVLTVLPIIPIAYAAGTIYMSPSSFIYTTDTAPTHFNVTVFCSDVDDDIGGANIYLQYDDDIINVTRWWPTDWRGDFFMPSPYTALPTPPDDAGYVHVGAGVGYVQVAVSKGGLPPTAPWGTNGSICVFEFEITAIPPKLGLLNCTLKIDDASTYLLDEGGLEIPGVVKNNGYYELSWAQPGPAKMGVSPTLTEYGPFPPSAVGEAFDIEVYIEDLYAAWYLANASFNLYYNTTVIDVLGGSANITFAPLWATTSAVVTHTTPYDYISIFVADPTSTPGGSPADELVCTIKFTVMMQDTVPPRTAGDYDSSPLDFGEVVLMDHVGPVTTTDATNGEVKIYCLIALPMALFKVEPPLVELGPEPSICTEFDVDIVIDGPTAEGLHHAWYLIGFQLRLYFDDTLLEVLSVTEGPFLKDGPWNLYGTWFTGTYEPNGFFGPHVKVGNMLLPNGTGDYDQTSWPNGTGSIVTIRFHAIKQEFCPCNYTGEFLSCELGLGPLFPGNWAIDKDGNWVPIDEGSIVNGTYKIYDTPSTGRVIDVYGGAVNRGYGGTYGTPFAFPAPFGGQGQDGNMDLVIPQSVVYLLASVKYNCWPVQSKDVGYEIEGPFLQEGWDQSDPETWIPREAYFIRKYANRTDDVGIAWIKFQMPWPCDDPEDLFGKYKVTATVDICGEVVTDILWFDYYYLVEITKVTTDKFYYVHCEDVEITIDFRSKAQQLYPVLLSVVIQDELETHFGAALVNVNVSGAEFCHWKEYTVTVKIHVIKWAFAGYATIWVSAFDKDPTEGGAPWVPMYGQGWPPGATVPEIYILPA